MSGTGTEGPKGGALFLLAVVFAACQASTTRPTFAPVPAALTAQLRLEPPEAFDTILAAFRSGGIPLQRVEARDGWFDSGWLRSPEMTPARSRAVGLDVVRIRGWVDLGKPYHARYTVETVYRGMLDPSREDRELERAVADTHPASLRVRSIITGILTLHGDPEDRKADSVATAWVKARMRTALPGDTVPARRDTTARREPE